LYFKAFLAFLVPHVSCPTRGRRRRNGLHFALDRRFVKNVRSPFLDARRGHRATGMDSGRIKPRKAYSGLASDHAGEFAELCCT